MPSKPARQPTTANSSPLFDAQGGWSAGYTLAVGQGPGAVVGPGPSSPSVFAQSFQTKPGKQYEIVVRASSVDRPRATASIQVNWHGEGDKFVGLSKELFKVTLNERSFQHTVVAPSGATHGILYVVPGGTKDLVRYTEMSLVRLNQARHFMSYEVAGVKGQTLLASGLALFLLALMYVFCRQFLLRTGAALGSRIGRAIVAIFPLIALAMSGALFCFLETPYEQHYDSQWHQASVESVFQWNELSPDLGGNPMHNFGIQHVINPQLSPTFWIGTLAPADHRIQVQAAFQASLLLSLITWLCWLAGARLSDASAIGLIAIGYLWIPFFSDEAISLNATLGLLWQEGAIATLIAFLCFSRIGYSGPGGKPHTWWPTAGLGVTILWFYLAYPELIAFFTLATASLCLGALFGVQSRRELTLKVCSAILIAICLLALGIYDFVLNLFRYTPQMYFKALYFQDFKALFFSNTSLLLASNIVGGVKIVAFFVLALAGGVVALRIGNRYARHLVIGGLALEVAIHIFSALNAVLEVVPLTFTYIELMGLPVVSILAGVAVWSGLRFGFRAAALHLRSSTPPKTQPLAHTSLRSEIGADQTLAHLALIVLVAAVFYRLETQSDTYSGWPPETTSEPAKIQSRELAVKSGDEYKGKGLMLLGMKNTGTAHWGLDFFPVLHFKYRAGLGNDLMNDAKTFGIPIANEYGHWISPPMLALFTAAFYKPEDWIDRAAQAPRAFRPNLARLLGVSLVISDEALPGEAELYRGSEQGHPLYIHRIAASNTGKYSPIRTVVARDAREILDHLQAPGFDGQALAIIETALETDLVTAERTSVSLHIGPKIHVESYSAGTSLLVLPFDYSHCLEVKGGGVERIVPVNLAQTGLIVRGRVSVDLAYRYGLAKGTSCRKRDLERIRRLNLEEAASGRLFHDFRRK
jgi:hypothetical protein